LSSIRKKSLALCALALAAGTAACSESLFKSDSKVKAGNRTTENVTRAAVAGLQVINKTCQIDLFFNQAQVDCYIPVSGNSHLAQFRRVERPRELFSGIRCRERRFYQSFGSVRR
jgi:hypothetical protein